MATKWTDGLNEYVYTRLVNCRTIKADIPALAQAKWNQIKSKPSFTKEDALISVLELLDCNNCYFDLAKGEYIDILANIH